MIKNIKAEIDLSSFYIVFDGSTMNEKPGWYGISHLMEHLVCKSFEHLQDDFQRYGINWNAYTSNTEVVFYMSGLDEYVNKFKNSFLNLILSYEPTDKHLENEKKIVLEEYKDTFNEQVNSHFLNLNRKMFGYYEPIGLKSDIENFTIEDCKTYLDLYFKKPTQIINVSKNNDFVSDVEFRENIITKPFNYIDSNNIELELVNEFKNKESIINISNIAEEDFAKIKFTCNILGSGLNSPLYQEVREKMGLVYYIQCVNQKLNLLSSCVTIITETSSENVPQVQYEISNILNNKEKFVTKYRFDVVKDNFIVKMKKNNILKHNNISKYIEPDNWNVDNIINNITLDDVFLTMEKYFNWSNFYKSIYSEEFNK